MAYNLGTIWLQVIPSFDGIQENARKAGRDIHAEFEKGYNEGEDAATQRRAARAEQQGKAEGAARAKGRESAQDAARQREAQKQQADTDKEVAAAQRRTESVNRVTARLVRQGQQDIEKFQAESRKNLQRAFDRMSATVKIDADSTPAHLELDRIQRKMRELGDKKIGVDLDLIGFAVEYATLEGAIRRLQGQDIDLDVDVDLAGAIAQLGLFSAAASRADGESRKLKQSMLSAGDASSSAANAFRTMNIWVLAATTIGPMAVPAILAVAGALASVATFGLAAGAAIGTTVLGLRGVGGAVEAMADLESEQRYGTPQRPAAERMRGPDRSVRDARLGVADAQRAAQDRLTAAVDRHEDALESIDDAQRRVTDAERNLTRAQEQARRAQEELTEAREDARREIEDMNNALISGTLSEQDALYDLEEARYSLFRIMQDGSATEREKERAQLSYRIQEQQYKELQLQNQRLGDDQAEVAARGVEGSVQVAAAQDNIVSAQERVADAQRGVADAEDAVVDAQQAAADAAADIARTREDNARNIERAEMRLADALADQATAAAAAAAGTGALDTATRKLQESLAGLSPQARRFAEWLFSLRGLWEQLQWTAQAGLLPGLQEGLSTFIDAYFPQILTFVGDMATLIGDLAVMWGEWVVQPEIMEFFRLLGDYSLVFMEQFGQIAPLLMEGLFGVITQLLPFTEDFGDVLVVAATAFAEWANSPEGIEAMTTFFDYLRQVSPQMWELFTVLLITLGKTLIGLTPYIHLLTEFFITVFTFLSEQDPTTLGLWATGLIIVVGSIQLLAGAISLILSPLQLLANVKYILDSFRVEWTKVFALFGIGKGAAGGGAAAGAVAGKGAVRGLLPWVARAGVIGAIIAAIIFGFLWLYDNVEPFRKWVDDFVAAIVTAWTDHIWPALQALWAFLVDTLGPVFIWLYENIVKPTWNFIVLAIDLAWTAIEVIFKLVVLAVKILGAIFEWLWENIIEPVWSWISGHIETIWKNNIQPVLETIGTFIQEHVAPLFEAGVQALGTAWDWLREMFAKPIVWVVDTVINDGLLATLNHVFKFFDIEEVDDVKIPQDIRNAAEGKFARGGIIPGYSPGRDTHEFWSPTAGRLSLSGGEAVLRPEVTAVLGEDFVNTVNAAAISGGTGGVAGLLGGRRHFALGGILDWGEGLVSGAWDAVTNVASWIGDIAEYAWNFATDPVGHLKKIAENLVSGVTDWASDSGIGQLITRIPTYLIETIGDAILRLLNPDPVVGSGGFFGGGSGWIWPTNGPISSPFGPRRMFGNTFHGGTDIRGGGPVWAAAPGEVVWAGPSRSPYNTGSLVRIAHPTGDDTAYGHMPYGSMTVEPGDVVRAGQQIGVQGAVGRVTGVHLHYEVHPGGWPNHFDPELWHAQAAPDIAAAGSGVGRWRGLAEAALRRTGHYSQTNLDAMLRRMNQESSGNPDAINNWDSNARRGTPSVGLMQVIGPTFAAHRDPALPNNPYDPMANMVAAINYTESRYGTLTRGWNRRGGYAGGGVVDLYDDGGWLPHGALALNLSGAPERVLSPEESEAFRRLVDSYGQTVVDIDVNHPGATAGEIADEMLFALRRARRGGAYV